MQGYLKGSKNLIVVDNFKVRNKRMLNHIKTFNSTRKG